ncbi:DUF5316 domain-containing protein [Paenibacillus sp. A14]|uniref:DUF5316 domain-containing protein n=1 Tax=Paenibacillus sp. A14 TaxID=3119820 RepID=UPI002FE15A3D
MRNVRITLLLATTSGFLIALGFGILDSWSMSLKVTGGIGIGAWLVAGIFTGSYINGDRSRANESIETPEDRAFRNKAAKVLFLFGIPFLIIALVTYLLTG